jgi:hypothetical protein
MARFVPLALPFALFALAAVAPGQPPMPPVTPAAATAPAPSTAPAKAAEAPISRFEPLAAYPLPTQNAVRSILLGSAWLTRMNQPHGRFLYGYRPSLRQPMAGDDDMAQARAALALARAARFTGGGRETAVAGQAILTLLASTKLDPADPECRVPVHRWILCNRVGFASLLALAIYELPDADDKLVGEAERLCGFLRKQLRSDGSVDCTGGAAEDAAKLLPKLGEYPGLALQALAAANRAKPAAWKVEALRKGLSHYREVFKKSPHPMLAATLTPAFTELNLQTRLPEAATAVFEMNDWLIGLQYATTDPRHLLEAGGFRDWANGQPSETEPGAECGLHVQSLACAYHLSRHGTDLNRAARYRQALLDAVQFVLGLQYIESNTRHFENNFRANMLIGGTHLTPTNGDLRIDATAEAMSGLLRFLSSGAEKD